MANLSLLRQTLPFLLMFPSLGHAATLMEIKAGYAIESVDPKDINEMNRASSVQLGSLTAINADVTAFFPSLPLGLGARYEKFTGHETSGGIETKARWERVSVLASYRAYDDGFYFGPIASLGVSNEFKYTITDNARELDFKTNGNLSASGGLEAGAKLSILRLGLEAGYLYAMLGEVKDASGSPVLQENGNAVKADLSGPYARVLVGLGF